MGTRGLYAYRYRRRYHTTYNHSSSYLDGLGSWRVAEVPVDPEKFREWVEKLKERLEEEYRGWKEDIKRAKDAAHDDTKVRVLVPECPFSMRAPTLTLFIEYTYVVDLDRNVFTVNEAVHFPLDAIPRGADGDEWIAAVMDKTHPARILHLRPTLLPPDSHHLALYAQCSATQSLIPSLKNVPFAFPTCGAIMDYFFRQFRFVYSPIFDDIAKYEPNHPDFLAMAQGILTLATWGQFCMSAGEFHSNDEEVTAVVPEWSDVTLDEADTHFWHFSTLIVLEVGIDDQHRLQSAVGKAIELWRASPKLGKNSAVFIISLVSVVVVRFSGGTVCHSAPVELLGASTESQPRFETFSHTLGFELLKQHFNPALPASSLNSGLALPQDVTERIFDLCDDAALVTLTYTCKSFRTLCLLRPRFRIGEYRILYHVCDNEFTAIDDSGVSLPVVVGKFGCAVPSRLPGGRGFELVLKLPSEGCDETYLQLMGLRCLPKAHKDAKTIVLFEEPEQDWRFIKISEIR